MIDRLVPIQESQQIFLGLGHLVAAIRAHVDLSLRDWFLLPTASAALVQPALPHLSLSLQGIPNTGVLFQPGQHLGPPQIPVQVTGFGPLLNPNGPHLEALYGRVRRLASTNQLELQAELARLQNEVVRRRGAAHGKAHPVNKYAVNRRCSAAP